MMFDPEFREALAGASRAQTMYELFAAAGAGSWECE